MANNEESSTNNEFDVIVYTEDVAFKYTLPNEDEERQIEHEL